MFVIKHIMAITREIQITKIIIQLLLLLLLLLIIIIIIAMYPAAGVRAPRRPEGEFNAYDNSKPQGLDEQPSRELSKADRTPRIKPQG